MPTSWATKKAAADPNDVLTTVRCRRIGGSVGVVICGSLALCTEGGRAGVAQARIVASATPTSACRARTVIGRSDLRGRRALPNRADSLDRRVGLEHHLHQAEV